MYGTIQYKRNKTNCCPSYFQEQGTNCAIGNGRDLRPDNTRVQIPAKTRVQIPAGGLIDCNYTGSNPGVGLDRSRSKVAVCL